MKSKFFTLITTTALVAAIGHVAPALADDNAMNNGQMMQPAAPTDNNQSQNGANASAAPQGSAPASGSSDNININSSNANNPNNPNDPNTGTPDTATGDDDY